MNRFAKCVVGVVLLSFLLFPLCAIAQQPEAKPYHEGPVWQINFIHAKGGMEDRYFRYLAETWKREQEALKSAGYILDYRVIATEAHGPQDFNVILMTQFKDLASMEANRDKIEATALQLVGGQQKMESGYQDRSSYRDLIGDRLGREIVLSPKGGR